MFFVRLSLVREQQLCSSEDVSLFVVGRCERAVDAAIRQRWRVHCVVAFAIWWRSSLQLDDHGAADAERGLLRGQRRFSPNRLADDARRRRPPADAGANLCASAVLLQQHHHKHNDGFQHAVVWRRYGTMVFFCLFSCADGRRRPNSFLITELVHDTNAQFLRFFVQLDTSKIFLFFKKSCLFLSFFLSLLPLFPLFSLARSLSRSISISFTHDITFFSFPLAKERVNIVV